VLVLVCSTVENPSYDYRWVGRDGTDGYGRGNSSTVVVIVVLESLDGTRLD